ncbi:MAG: hypothetical protein Q9227_008645 [Pyrenula ochraceoflavens]
MPVVVSTVKDGMSVIIAVEVARGVGMEKERPGIEATVPIVPESELVGDERGLQKESVDDEEMSKDVVNVVLKFTVASDIEELGGPDTVTDVVIVFVDKPEGGSCEKDSVSDATSVLDEALEDVDVSTEGVPEGETSIDEASVEVGVNVFDDTVRDEALMKDEESTEEAPESEPMVVDAATEVGKSDSEFSGFAV